MRNIAAIIMLLLSSPALAAPPTILRNYEYFIPKFEEWDNACISALIANITIHFEGLTEVHLQSSSFMQIASSNHTLGTYVEAQFISQYGNVQGVINCVLLEDGTTVSDILVIFEGRGLAGFLKHPLARVLNDPSKQFSQSFSSSPAR